MGIVRRQATYNTVINFVGAGIGALNYIYLLPKFFPTEYIGVIRLVLSIATLLQFLSAFGFVSVFIKFFPKYKDEKSKHIYFVGYVIKRLVAGVLIISLIYVFAKPVFIKFYVEKSPLYIKFYYYVLPVFWALLLNSFLDNVLALLYKTVFSNFVKEILTRLLLTFSLVLHLFLSYSIDEAIAFYFSGYIFVILLMLPQLFTGTNRIYLSGKGSEVPREERKSWLKYAFYSFFAGSTFMLLSNIDSMMLGSMVNLKVLGVYSVYMYMATILVLPTRGLQKIARTPLVEAITKNDKETILRLYSRTSLIQSSIAAFIMLGIILNKEIFFFFIKKPEFEEYFIIFVFLALGIWIDITGGVNGLILSLSDFYQYDLYVNVIVVFANVILNYVLILLLGGVGAAVATMLSYLINNLLRTYFVYKKMGLQPFSINHLIMILIALISFVSVWFLPDLNNLFVSHFYKSVIFSTIYIGLLLLFKVVPDYNNFGALIVKKLKNI